MALTRNNLGTWFSTTVTTSFTTGSFTPDSNSILAICAHTTDGGAATLTITDSLGTHLTYTKQVDQTDTFPFHRAVIWTAPVATGASMTVTIGGSPGSEVTVHAFDWTGYNTSTPTGATAKGQVTAAGAVNITLSAAPASSSEVIGFFASDTNAGGAITAGTGWTEQFFTNDGVNCTSESETRNGSTSTTVTWNNNAAGLGAEVALEIIAAAGAGAGFATQKQNFKVDKFKTPLHSMGPNAGLFQVRAFPIAASTAQPDTSGQVIFRVRNQPWRW